MLLVEDEDQVRDVAQAILRRHGYVVLVAQQRRARRCSSANATRTPSTFS